LSINFKDLRSLLAIPNIFRLFGNLMRAQNTQLFYIQTYIRPQAGDRILDIGCGQADLLAYFPEVEYLGFDMEKKYIDAAVKRYGSRGQFHCLKVSEATLKEYPAFDIVLAKGILHHLDDTEAGELFQLARKTLQPSGRLITIDGCYVEGRSKLEHYILSKDRGRYVRTQAGYYELASKVFPQVKVNLHHDLLRIPYTMIVMECAL
jgi:2-polyprenyl-3-methyl-5-hydroxy-6-metoxy-1,4-benzoquinol methylase